MKNKREFIGVILVTILIFTFIATMSNIKEVTKKSNPMKIALNIVSQDINTDKEVTVATVNIGNDVTLEMKLSILANELSKQCFDKLPIRLVEIKEIDGKNIAVFDLRESEENEKIENWNNYEGKSWANNYFQGSAGGGHTTYTLQETFLQRHYDGNWVDGVQFLYKGEENKFFQHVEGLNAIKYREDDNN